MKKFFSIFIFTIIISSLFIFVNTFKGSYTTNRVFAAGETIKIERVGAEQNSQTSKWDWRFLIDTTGGKENANIVMKIYKGSITSDGTNIIYQGNVAKLKNNHAEPNTDFILDNDETYSVSFLIEMTPVLHSYYKNITGDNSSEGDIVNFTPQTNTSTNTDDTYTLLAPIGDFTEAPNNIGKYFNKIFLIVIGLCGALAVIMIVIGGVEYMGDESIFGKTEAKSRITKAILGLIIALASYALLNTVNPDLLGGRGVNIKQVTAEIEEGNQYRLLMTQDTPGAKTFKRTSYYNQIKTIATNSGIPHCLIQVAIQRESGGKSSIGHDEDVPVSAIPSRRSFISSGKKFDGTTFETTGENDKKITQKSFKNTDHPSNYLLPPNPSVNDLGLDWRFSHSVGLFGVTFGPNHINPSGAKKIYSDAAADVVKATEMMKDFYNRCNKDIEGTWRAYNSGKCNGNNSFTNREAPIRVNLYDQCVAQDN